MKPRDNQQAKYPQPISARTPSRARILEASKPQTAVAPGGTNMSCRLHAPRAIRSLVWCALWLMVVALALTRGALVSAAQPKIVAGQLTSFAITSTGNVYGWGSGGMVTEANTFGSTFEPRLLSISSIVDIAFSYDHAIALTSSGTVLTWGMNTYGKLGNGTVGGSNFTPTLVPGLTGIVGIAAGSQHTLALKSDGTVWAWGQNQFGQLANANLVPQATPTQIAGLTGITHIASSTFASHSLAVSDSGTLWAWGSNASGQLGDNSKVDRSTPVQVTGLSNVADARAGSGFSVALMSDGTVWSWGYNGSGQLGDRTANERLVPVQVWESPTTQLANVVAISVGESHTFAMKTDKSVWGFGSSTYGAFGDGVSQIFPYAPTYAIKLAPLQGMTVSAGGSYGLGFYDDGSVWAWGRNFRTEMGVAPTIAPASAERDLPSPVQTPAGGGQLSLLPSSTGNWLNVQVAGKGTVKSTVGGVDCGVTCSAKYLSGARVSLVATPTIDTAFAGWFGDCSGTGGCTVDLSQPAIVVASFVPRKVSISALKTGGGTGLVNTNSGNINCGSVCIAQVDSGSTNIFFATPNSGSVFLGWKVSADTSLCTDRYLGCAITPRQNTAVTAIFESAAAVPSAPAITGSSAGNRLAAIFFDPPSSNGGYGITNYFATCDGTAGTWSSVASPIHISGLTNGTTYTCHVTAQNLVGNGIASNAVTVTPTQGAQLALLSAVLRKTHGAAGTFDLPINLLASSNATTTVEPRAATWYSLIFHFNNPVTSIGQSQLMDGATQVAALSGLPSSNGQVEFVLSNPPTNKVLGVSVTGINGTVSVSFPIIFLPGNVSGSGTVSSVDLRGVRNHSGQIVSKDNFIYDVSLSGIINATDIVYVKKRQGATVF